MTDIAIDYNPLSSTYQDVILVDGDLEIVDGPQAILQNIVQTLGTYLHEWFLNLNVGIDYFGQILVKTPNQSTVDAIFINQILNVPGVQALLAYSFNPNFVTRGLALTFKAQVTGGVVDYTGTINS